MAQNTFHPQTARFIASLCTSLPELDRETMQLWISNPGILQETLTKALNPVGSGQLLVEEIAGIALEETPAISLKKAFFESDEVSFSYIGSGMRELIEAGNISAFGYESAVFLKVHRLLHPITQESMIKAVGGVHHVISTPLNLYRALRKQPRGESGSLLINGQNNYWFMQGEDDALVCVFSHWQGKGWVVRTLPTNKNHLFTDGSYIVG